ncbi:MAG: LemA family protein [Candidatus Omnitrophica bacterium]|nr:LemA family protein [Candidatus Omnitrophota bacterium]
MLIGIIIAVFVIAGICIVMLISIYNSLVSLRNRVKNGWAQIDVQLKRRYDLIPNLVEVVKGYMKHERETLEKVVQARQQAINISGKGNVAEQAKAENFLSQTLKSLFAVSERYPDLKANQNMLQLQEELTSTENKIAFARQYYNDEVMRYNTKIEIFPDSIIASMFNFTKEEMFELEDSAQREAPKVEF